MTTDLQQAAARVAGFLDEYPNPKSDCTLVAIPDKNGDLIHLATTDLRTLLGAVEEIDRLTNCLEKANANHEHFEREWYLQKDKAESQATEIERLRAENEKLARFICDFGHADLDDMAADGVTVGMVFQKEAKRIAKDAGWEMGPHGDQTGGGG